MVSLSFLSTMDLLVAQQPSEYFGEKNPHSEKIGTKLQEIRIPKPVFGRLSKSLSLSF